MRRESNEAEGTYREAAEEVDRDCRRDIWKRSYSGRRSNPRKEKEQPKKKGQKKESPRPNRSPPIKLPFFSFLWAF